MRPVYISIIVTALSVTAVSAEPAKPMPTHASHRGSKLVALTAAGLWLTSMAIGSWAKLDEVSTGKPANDPTVSHRFTRDRDIAEYAGDSFFAASCVALGVAGALFIHERHVYEHTLVLPTVAPGQFGIAATGSF